MLPFYSLGQQRIYLISISNFPSDTSSQVGMQNSSLGVVLATSHFTSPMVAVPPAVSAVIMNIMGSSLAFLWRYKDPLNSEKNSGTESTEKCQ